MLPQEFMCPVLRYRPGNGFLHEAPSVQGVGAYSPHAPPAPTPRPPARSGIELGAGWVGLSPVEETLLRLVLVALTIQEEAAVFTPEDLHIFPRRLST